MGSEITKCYSCSLVRNERCNLDYCRVYEEGPDAKGFDGQVEGLDPEEQDGQAPWQGRHLEQDLAPRGREAPRRTALLALLVIVGGFDLPNAHPHIAAAPFECAIWHGALAALGVTVFHLVERRRRRAAG